MLKIGLLGFGTVGRGVAQAVRRGDAGETEVVAVLVREPLGAEAGGDGLLVTCDPAAFLASDLELVVEAAGHAALRRHAETILAAGKDLMTVSVGAFADADFLERVRAVAREHGRRILVPSGAIAALDAISAAAVAPVEEVIHTVRKPPRAFTAAQLGGDSPADGPVLLFDGSARDGARLFPENVNVAAAVGLAGIRLDRTRLRVIADPTLARNTHELEVRGEFGRLHVTMENVPSENPKTARIVAWSIAKALRNLSAPMWIGL